MKAAFLVEVMEVGQFPLFPARKEYTYMKKTYKYRLYPTKKQEHVLNEQLALCTELYNAALQERKEAYQLCGKSITFTQQCAQLPAIKAIRPEYEAIYSQVLQDVLHRVDKAFKAFFSRVKAGQTPGYPRYKSRFRYASLTYPQTGFGIDEQGKLSLAKIGHLKMIQHRPTRGAVKTCTIVRNSTGTWWVCFSCDEVEPQVLPPSDESSVSMWDSRPLLSSPPENRLPPPGFSGKKHNSWPKRSVVSPKRSAVPLNDANGARSWHESMSASAGGAKTSSGRSPASWSSASG